jgi:ABC-type branched-subunit amino acid transport system substrate-binding protein
MGKAPMPAGADSAGDAARVIATSNAQAYVMILAPNSGAGFVRDVRAAHGAAPIYAMSYVTADLLTQRAGPEAAGVALAQVTPNPESTTTAESREFHEALRNYGPPGTKPTSLSFVGYLAARVIVEGLRRARTPSPAALQESLRNLRVDLGSFYVDFTDGTNVGSHKVDIGVVDSRGILRY